MVAIIAAAVIVPTGIYSARWPNTLYEAAFPTAHSPRMDPESSSSSAQGAGYGPYAGSFVDVRTEAEFEATLADIRRRGVQPERRPVAAPSAIVQDGPECFSKLTKYNVCERAREIQREVAASLPMKMSEKITLSMVAVVGPRLVLTSIWHSNKSDIDASRRVGGTSPADADERMSQAARNGVCSRSPIVGVRQAWGPGAIRLQKRGWTRCAGAGRDGMLSARRVTGPAEKHRHRSRFATRQAAVLVFTQSREWPRAVGRRLAL